MALAFYSFTALIQEDSSGRNAIANQSLVVNISGTGTPAAIFSDAAGTTPIAQPGAQTNSAGVFNFYVASGVYDIVSGGRTETVQLNAGEGKVFNHATLQALIQATDISEGDASNVAERTAGNGGGAMWDVVLATSVTPNTFNIVQCTGVLDLAVVLRKSTMIDVRQWGATGNGTANDGPPIAHAAQTLQNFETIFFPPGRYRVDETIDFRDKAHINIIGLRRNSIILVNHTASAAFYFDNGSFVTKTRRGIIIDGISFYSYTTSGNIPSHSINMRSCPEALIQNCTFINSSTASQVLIWESWSSEVAFNYFAVLENSAANYGANYNPSATGAGLHVGTDTHAVDINNNRIRAGIPGLLYEGGDASSIYKNSIESNQTDGVLINNSCSALSIASNYFEGPNVADIRYTSLGTNGGHSIKDNFFHATLGVDIDSNTECSGLVIKNNLASSTAQFLRLGTGIAFKGLALRDNTLKELTDPYSFGNAEMANVGLTDDNNKIEIDDYNLNPLGGLKIPKKKTLIEVNSFGWQTFSGIGSYADASINHNGIQMYDLVGTSNLVAFYGMLFDPGMRNMFVTINAAFITPAGTNVTVTVDDGVGTKNFICNSGSTGAAAPDNMMYYKLDGSATKLNVRISVGTMTIQALFPTARLGMHSDPEYLNAR